MLRWLVRLLVLAVIAIVGVIVVSRLTNRDEDFDDYDDLEAGFDFQETPVEIEVPAEQSAATAGQSATSSPGGSDTNAASSASMETTRLGEENEDGNRGGQLTDITGIGPAFSARLQAIGINSPSDLAQADANSLSEQLDVIGGLATIEDWISQAKNLSSQAASNGHA